jgi:hypothetical protein
MLPSWRAPVLPGIARLAFPPRSAVILHGVTVERRAIVGAGMVPLRNRERLMSAGEFRLAFSGSDALWVKS